MRTFTYDQLEGKMVPKPSDFRAVVGKIQEALSQNPLVEWAILAGSVLRGTQSVASDLDVVICFKELSPRRDWTKALHDVRFDLHEVSLRRHIPLEINIVTVDAFATNTHTLGPGYVRHLQWAVENGGLLTGKADPLEPLPITAFEDALEYITRKLLKIRKYLSAPRLPDYWPDEIEGNAEVLSTWKHALRRYAEAMCENLAVEKELETAKALLPKPAQQLVERLDENVLTHLDAIQSQLMALDPIAWSSEQTRIHNHEAPILHTLLLELQNQLLGDRGA